MLSLARNRKKYDHLEIANLMGDLSFHMFDIIVANGVLGHLGNSKSIYEFARVLKSGGSFLFTMRTSHFSERGWKRQFMNGKLKVTRKEADV